MDAYETPVAELCADGTKPRVTASLSTADGEQVAVRLRMATVDEEFDVEEFAVFAAAVADALHRSPRP